MLLESVRPLAELLRLYDTESQAGAGMRGSTLNQAVAGLSRVELARLSTKLLNYFVT